MPEGVRKTEAGRPLFAPPARERAIAELFEAQQTVATVGQLAELGLSPRSVRHRAQIGRLYRLYHGVYSTTPPALLSRRGRWLAAVLACGPGALLSHRSAAALHGIRDTRRAGVDVTSPRSRGRGHKGIDAHRATTLTPADIATVDGIPCTSLARAVVDLAPLVNRRAVERAIDQSDMLEIFDLRAFDDVLARNPTHRGAPIVRGILDEYQRQEAHFSTLTENEFEEAFFALCDAAGFPRPEVQQYLILPGGEPVRADFMWRDLRIIVETDGGKFHRTYWTRERNATTDLLLAEAGWQTVRLTSRMVFIRPAETTKAFAGVLARARARQYSQSQT
jgi:Transcriptional regulator, AbiEi antitoxin